MVLKAADFVTDLLDDLGDGLEAVRLANLKLIIEILLKVDLAYFSAQIVLRDGVHGHPLLLRNVAELVHLL